MNIQNFLDQFDGLIWFLVLIVPLIIIQSKLHFEIQAVLLLITRRTDLSSALFAILFFPGVFLHETSHFLMARMLGVTTVGFSLIPASKPDGKLQLGYVETVKTDVLRDAIIGAAPLITGGIFVAFAGVRMLNLGMLWETLQSGDLVSILDAILNLSKQPDFWLWFYLTLAVSSTMFPSASDRRAWFPVLLLITLALLIGIIAGAGPWLFNTVSPLVSRGFRTVAVIFAVSLTLHLVILFPIAGVRHIISRLTNLKVR